MSTYYHEEWHRNQSILQSFTFSDRSLRYRNSSKITLLICEPYTHEPGLAETTLQSFHSLHAEISPLDPRASSRDGNFQWCCSCRERTHCVVSLGRKARIRVVPHFSSRDSRASARENHPTREKATRVGWFSRTLAFRSLYYPWGEMGDYSWSSTIPDTMLIFLTYLQFSLQASPAALLS